MLKNAFFTSSVAFMVVALSGTPMMVSANVESTVVQDVHQTGQAVEKELNHLKKDIKNIESDKNKEAAATTAPASAGSPAAH